MSEEIKNRISEFRTKEEKNKTKGKRTYIHFDFRTLLTSQLLDYITNPEKIVRHSFYPFLHINLKIRRYKKEQHHTVDKERSIFYASHVDSFIYSWYATLLNHHYEKYIKAKGFESSVLAYRKIKADVGSKCNIHFAKEVFDFISQQNDCVVVAFDISKFFDTLDHKILKDMWLQILGAKSLPEDQYKIFRSLTKFSYVERNEVFKIFKINLNRLKDRHTIKQICNSEDFRNKVREGSLIKINPENYGIPQGSPLSALLSNIYMINFDELLYNFVKGINGLYRRYSDDMIVVCKQEDLEKVTELVLSEIEKYKLTINQDKTEKISFGNTDDGHSVNRTLSTRPLLQYLGFEFNGRSMLIRSASMSRYYRKMKRRIRKLGMKAKKYKFTQNIFKRKVYESSTHLGKQNFITYAKNAARVTDSQAIKKQIKPHWKKVQKELQKIAT